jgi:hypothetical protein
MCMCIWTCKACVQETIVASTLGVLLGWPVAGVAFLPFVVLVLLKPRLHRSFAVLSLVALPVLAVVVITDFVFYGKTTV